MTTATQFPRAPLAEILISYRDEGTPAGKGAFYDHYTLQKHTSQQTAILHSPKPAISIHDFKRYIVGQTQNLPKSLLDQGIQRPVPPVRKACVTGGLLVIPGMSHQSDQTQNATHKIRIAFEEQMIKQVRLQGRPIIAICAGSWTLWKTLGGQLIDVSDHNYGAGMPKIGVNGNIVNNKRVHNIVVEPNSLLQKAMKLKASVQARTLPVNSVHWRAPSEATLPCNFKISARSAHNDDIEIKTRQGNDMSPDPNTVEAYESVHGAPIIGFVWHPEAFDWRSADSEELPHRRVLFYMAKAGNAYRARVQVTKQFKETLTKVENHEVDGLCDALKNLEVR